MAAAHPFLLLSSGGRTCAEYEPWESGVHTTGWSVLLFPTARPRLVTPKAYQLEPGISVEVHPVDE
jgi:hypothetical protein